MSLFLTRTKLNERMIKFILLLLLPGVTGEKVAGRRLDEDICRSYGFSVINAKFGKEQHLLCLKLKPIGKSALTSVHTALLLDPEPEEDQNSIRAMSVDNITMAYGFSVEDSGAGSAEGYIGDDNEFYGVLHFKNRTLHADPYGRDDPKKFFGAFENDDMHAPRSRRDYSQINPGFPYFPYEFDHRPHVPGIARARICDLLLLADKEFYEKDANASLNDVVRRMLHSIAQADIIFRNADFNEDDVPDNIGFSVKYILVLTSEETNTRVFGNLLRTKSVDGRDYLMKFARLRRLSEVCLGVAFSGHAFHNRTLGLSFTSLGGGLGGAAGGVCDRRAYGRSFNTLAIAHATTDDSDRVPERIAALTLAHEMGHSFGAHHDDNFPNPECRGHLMGSQSTTAVNGLNFEFSLCSKRLIAATLSSMSYCLTEEDRPYCGNGIVEEGEACDCGLPSRCSHRDPCCTPRPGGALVFDEGTLHKEGCSVAPSAVCHPSEGLCCLPNCRHADHSQSGIDCTNHGKPCTCRNNTADCKCGIGGRCLSDGSCHAAECALLGYRECQCIKAPGGRLAEVRHCGVCCLVHHPLEGTLICIGAEQAAGEYLRNEPFLPIQWPLDDYSGPNVTIEVCSGAICHATYVRAWAVGTPCVTLGFVGACSPRGVCKRIVQPPRSNIYPDILIFSSPFVYINQCLKSALMDEEVQNLLVAWKLEAYFEVFKDNFNYCECCGLETIKQLRITKARALSNPFPKNQASAKPLAASTIQPDKSQDLFDDFRVDNEELKLIEESLVTPHQSEGTSPCFFGQREKTRINTVSQQ